MRVPLFLLLTVSVYTVVDSSRHHRKRIALAYHLLESTSAEDDDIDYLDPDYEDLDITDLNSVKSTYLLFTRNDPSTGELLRHNDSDSIFSSTFNSTIPTVVLVHDWLGDEKSALNNAIKIAYLDKNEANVIVVDWSYLSRRNFQTASNGIPAAGRALGQFLNFLTTASGQLPSKMHLVGHGLGAHLAGNAGRQLNGAVARITALDPASNRYNSYDRLSESDAVYVEGIHTNARRLGIDRNAGHADFYPNGGIKQPGCETSACSHDRSWQLFAATITYNHLSGIRCKSFNELLLDWCYGSPAHMGNDHLRKNLVDGGVYRMTTGEKYPYSQVLRDKN